MQNIVVVDEHDNVVGEEEKDKCHDGGGILHRAFLAMVFNSEGELLLARRSAGKRLWPGYWDGTVASHVTKGEDYEQASRRRLAEEIGIEDARVQYLFKFQYKAGYKDIGTEHEICAVTVANNIDAGSVLPDGNEISDIRFMGIDALVADIRNSREPYTPWLLLAIEHLQMRHLLKPDLRMPLTA